jgi:Fe-S cluster assembly protein SufD
MSRGIPAEQARQMLIEAFLADALDDVGDETLRDFAMQPVENWLTQLKEAS